MSMEDTPVGMEDTDLDAFAADFFGQKSEHSEPASSEGEKETEEAVDDALEQTDTQVEDDTLAEDDIEEEAEEDPKPKKSRFQERIDELTGKAREAERREMALQAKLDEVLAKLNKDEKPEQKADIKTDKNEPTPDDLDADGNEKYPLGEFDPRYIRDLTKFTLEQERNALNEERQRQEAQAKADEARKELQTGWNSKVETAQERYPDFLEKGEALVDTFGSIDQAYGEYLSATLMQMEYGTDVLYYLANNPDIAKQIVDSGPTKATIALGRLEAKFAVASEEPPKKIKPSQAPVPPPVNKGTNPPVLDDLDDLDAFSAKLFKKRRS